MLNIYNKYFETRLSYCVKCSIDRMFKLTQAQQELFPHKHFQAMVAGLFWKTRYIVPLEKRRAIKFQCYKTIHKVRKPNRWRQNYLPLDSGNSHTSTETTAFRTLRTSIMSLSLHSSDLAPSDFFLFICPENKLRSQPFSISENAVDAFTAHVSEIRRSERQTSFESCFKSIQKFINLNGEYFGKQCRNIKGNFGKIKLL